jgi:hypothetical protein
MPWNPGQLSGHFGNLAYFCGSDSYSWLLVFIERHRLITGESRIAARSLMGANRLNLTNLTDVHYRV